MSKPNNIDLYNLVKLIANEKFKSRSGIYRSMFISKYYKLLGGTYDKPKPKISKIQNWLDEKWIDLNQPIKKNNKIIGYERCGNKNTQNNLYPLCRPSRVINSDTPQTYQTISKSKISKVNKEKQILRNQGNILF